MEELRNACRESNRDPYAPLPKKFQQPFQVMPIPAADIQQVKKHPVTKVKTDNENPSSATPTGTELAKSSQGAPVMEVSDWISQNNDCE